MTHNSEHVIIHLTTPVEIAKVKTRGGIAGLALLVAGFLIGLIFG